MKQSTAFLIIGIFFIAHTNLLAANSSLDSSDKIVSNTKGIITGADQTEKYLSYLKGKRVGMVANQTSIIGSRLSVDSGQVNLTWLIELYKAYPDKEKFFPINKTSGIAPFDLRSGTASLREQIVAGIPEAEIRKSWEPGLKAFKTMRAKYLLYPDK